MEHGGAELPGLAFMPNQIRMPLAKRLRITATLSVAVTAGSILAGCTESTPSTSHGSPATTSPMPQSEASGKLTEDQYKSALNEFRVCVEDSGATPGPIEELSSKNLGFAIDYTSGSAEEQNTIAEKVQACEGSFRPFGQQWAQQNKPTEQDYESLRPKVIECISPIVSGVTPDLTRVEVIQKIKDAISGGLSQSEELRHCLEEYKDFFIV